MSADDFQSAEVNDVRLAYVERGSGFDPAVVFVHGGYADYRSWRFQLEPFANKGYHTIAYSRRYAWPNKREGNYSDNSIQNNAADLVALLDRLGISSAHLIGVTTGGFISLFLALNSPERVRTLVLGEPSVISLLIKNPNSRYGLLSLYLTKPSVVNSVMRVTRTIRSARRALMKGDADTAASLLVDGLLSGDPRFPPREGEFTTLFDRIPQWIQTMYNDNVGDLKEGLAPIEDPRFNCVEARRIAATSLLIKSEFGKPFHPIVNQLSKCLPSSETVTIPGVGVDFGRWFEPYPFNDIVLDFLARHRV